MYNLFEAHFNIFKSSIIHRAYKNLIAVMQYLPALLTYRDTLSAISVSFFPPASLSFKTLQHYCLVHNILMRKYFIF